MLKKLRREEFDALLEQHHLYLSTQEEKRCIHMEHNKIIELNSENFCDSHFLLYLQQTYDLSKKGFLTHDECLQIETIDVSNRQIEDMTGLKHFPNLTSLDVSHNEHLITLNIENNPKLTHLYVKGTNIWSLDVENNASLCFIDCGNYFENTDDEPIQHPKYKKQHRWFRRTAWSLFVMIIVFLMVCGITSHRFASFSDFYNAYDQMVSTLPLLWKVFLTLMVSIPITVLTTTWQIYDELDYDIWYWEENPTHVKDKKTGALLFCPMLFIAFSFVCYMFLFIRL